jgi:molecular chaperone GrpE
MAEFAVPDITPIPEAAPLPIKVDALAPQGTDMAEAAGESMPPGGLLDLDAALAEALAAVEAVEAKHSSGGVDVAHAAMGQERGEFAQDPAPAQRPEIRGMPTVGSADARSQLTEQVRDLKLKLADTRRHQERDQKEIEQLMADLAVTRKRYHKLGTELDELRKRLQRAELDLPDQGARNVLNALLTPLDHLHEVMEYLAEHEPVSGQGLEAIRMLRNEWQRAFAMLQVTPFDALGQTYDPHLHEFIAQTQSEAPAGQVIRQVGRGYLLGGRLLRSARVVVSGGANPPVGEDESGMQDDLDL